MHPTNEIPPRTWETILIAPDKVSIKGGGMVELPVLVILAGDDVGVAVVNPTWA